jgi:hypothetical protein
MLWVHPDNNRLGVGATGTDVLIFGSGQLLVCLVGGNGAEAFGAD